MKAWIVLLAFCASLASAAPHPRNRPMHRHTHIHPTPRMNPHRAPDGVIPLIDGAGLASGWTFVPGSGTPATYAVIDWSTGVSWIEISLPALVAKDSIFSLGGTDDSAGLVRAVDDDFDIAVCLGINIKGYEGLGYGFIITGATDASQLRYSLYAGPTQAKHYGYVRSGGTDATFQAPADTSSDFNAGHSAWLRAKRVAATDTWTFYMSSDGFTWLETATVVRDFVPLTIKLICTNTAPAPGGLLAYYRVVDLIELGDTDARSRRPSGTAGTTVTTDFASLPAWLTTATAFGGTAGVSGGVAVLTTDVTVNDSYGRLVNTGSTYDNAGLLLRVKYATRGDSDCFAIFGLGTAAGGIDQYSAGPGYIVELRNTADELRILRVNMPDVIGADFEEPYVFLKPATAAPDEDVWVWWRIERVSSHLRIRYWLDGASEPSTWNWEFEDPMLNGFLEPVVGLSHNDGIFGTVSPAFHIDDLTFYRITL